MCVCVCVCVSIIIRSGWIARYMLIRSYVTRWLIYLQYMHCVGVWGVHVGLYQCTCGGALMALSSSHTGPRGQK